MTPSVIEDVKSEEEIAEALLRNERGVTARYFHKLDILCVRVGTLEKKVETLSDKVDSANASAKTSAEAAAKALKALGNNGNGGTGWKVKVSEHWQKVALVFLSVMVAFLTKTTLAP